MEYFGFETALSLMKQGKKVNTTAFNPKSVVFIMNNTVMLSDVDNSFPPLQIAFNSSTLLSEEWYEVGE